VREAPEDDSDRGGHVADCIKGLIVADDLKHVGCLRSSEPAPSIHCNPEIAPVFHTEDRGTVNQVGAGVREEPRRFCADDPPVADRDDFGVVAAVRQTKVGEH
jgi:hypothetical protein